MTSTDSLPISNRIAIDLAQPLDIPSAQIVKYLTVKIGDTISEGTVLARKKKSLWGLSSLEIKSPVEGIVAQIDDLKGVLLIETKPLEEATSESVPKIPSSTPKDPPAPMIIPETPKLAGHLPAPDPTPKLPPTVPLLSSNSRPLSPATQGIIGNYGFGISSGEGYRIKTSLNSEMITPELKGKILLISEVPSLALMFKASAVGIKAVVAAGNDLTASQQLAKELEGRAQIGFLLVSSAVDLEPFNHKSLQVEGKERRLEILD